MTKKIATPCLPPISPPITISSPVIRPSSSAVFKKLIAPRPRDFRMLSDDSYPLSVLFLTPLHKFRQNAGDFPDLDRIDRRAPENGDLPVPRRMRTPSRGIGRPEDRHARR